MAPKASAPIDGACAAPLWHVCTPLRTLTPRTAHNLLAYILRSGSVSRVGMRCAAYGCGGQQPAHVLRHASTVCMRPARLSERLGSCQRTAPCTRAVRNVRQLTHTDRALTQCTASPAAQTQTAEDSQPPKPPYPTHSWRWRSHRINYLVCHRFRLHMWPWSDTRLQCPAVLVRSRKR